MREAGVKFEAIERKLLMLEEFSEKKSRYIEKNINDKFELTEWKLFEKQVNGGQREICEAMLGGVPYSSDLNTGAKINVGLDCIRTLQKHYGTTLPVWIDNAESVTQWHGEEDLQTIKLVANSEFGRLEVVLNGD